MTSSNCGSFGNILPMFLSTFLATGFILAFGLEIALGLKLALGFAPPDCVLLDRFVSGATLAGAWYR